jgi:predicted methyltransferase
MKARSLLACLLLMVGHAAVADLRSAVESDHRDPANRARDQYRHPIEVLEFLGLREDMNVVDLWPGRAAWWTEILAPFLAEEGQLTAVIFGDQTDRFRNFMLSANDDFRAKMAADPKIYGRVKITSMWAPRQLDIAPSDSADMVLAMRNLHNWLAWGQVDPVLATLYSVLKPGGILAVVDHRLPADRESDPAFRSGYVKEATAINTITAAGFEFLGRSDINNNPSDTADHPAGVWTLPPTLRLGNKNREKWLAIGESDRFTLKFRKPLD